MAADKSDDAKARAEGQFRKREQRSREGDQARADNAATARAVDEKTARLKGLRLAKEGADRDAAAQASEHPAKSGKRQPKLVADPDEAKGG